MVFLWDDANAEHIATHGVRTSEAEEVVRGAKRPFPRSIGDGKYLVRGQSSGGRYLQVIFVYRAVDDLDIEQLGSAERLSDRDEDDLIYVIHARDLSLGERRTIRK